MKLKTAFSDFDGDYKAYAVKTASGWTYQGEDYGRSVDIGEGKPQYALRTNDLMEVYGDTQALKVINAEDGKPWPQRIKIYESGISLAAISLTCKQISQLMERYNENPDSNPVFDAFVAMLEENNSNPLSSIFCLASAGVRSNFYDDPDLSVTPTTIEHAAKAALKTKDCVVIHDDSLMTAIKMAHTYMIMNETTHPGYMARNPRTILAMLMVSNDRKPVKLPVPAENTDMVVKIPRELKKLGL